MMGHSRNPTYLFKVCCLVLLLIGQSIPMPQYDNVEYELIDEEYEDPEEPEPEPQIPLSPDPGATITEPENKPTIFKLPENYSVHKSPPLIDGEPIPVDFSILVFNVFDIKEIQEEISLEVNYKLAWKDTRLMNWTKNIEPGQKFTVLSTTLLHRLWHPDIFIDHVKRVTQPSLISTASSLRIYSDGSLRYTARMLIVITCRMDFHYYPADTQECNVTMKSFAFSTKQITLAWKDGIGALLAKSIDVHNFDVALETFPDYLQQTKSNNYSALSFGIRLRRKLSYHIIQTYVPSTMFTIVSWLSFLVPPDSTPGRMAICVTTLLTVTAMFGSVKQNTPNVSYIKALDVWMFLCIVFIFLSLAEFTIILKLRSKKEKHKKPRGGAKNKPRPDLLKKSNVINNASLDFKEDEAKKKAAATTVTPAPPAAVVVVPSAEPAQDKQDNSVPKIVIPRIPPPATARNNIAGHANDPWTSFPPPAPVTSGTVTSIAQALPAATIVASGPAVPSAPKPTRYAITAGQIEKYAPRILPSIFFLFTCVYWPYLLLASEYYSLSEDPDMYYHSK